MGSNEYQISINKEDQACLDALLLSNHYVFPSVLKAAVDLDLFEIIHKAGPGIHLSPSEIASQIPGKTPETASRLDRVLRLFATHSLMTYSLRNLDDGQVERLYGLTPASHFFLKRKDEPSLAYVVALGGHRTSQEVWLHVKEAVVEGGNQFKNVHGMSIFEYMDKDPLFNDLFNDSMFGLTQIIMKKMLEIYNGFQGLTSLVDVAGGTGKCLNMIISKYPSIKGINFDLPHVIETAPSYPGIEHIGGSMFTSIPKADAIMIKDTLHNWSDENCIKVLKNCLQVLPENGKVIVINMIVPEEPDSSVVSQYISRLDNIMLMQPGGKERTEKDFEILCKGAGFSSYKVVCCAHSIWSLLEFYK